MNETSNIASTGGSDVNTLILGLGQDIVSLRQASNGGSTPTPSTSPTARATAQVVAANPMIWVGVGLAVVVTAALLLRRKRG